VALTEEQFRVCENWMPRIIFGPKPEEARAGWRNCTLSSIVVLIIKDEHGYQIKTYELGWPSGTHGRNEKRLGLRNFSWKARRKSSLLGLHISLHSSKIDFW
jgi:hypothetical protein